MYIRNENPSMKNLALNVNAMEYERKRQGAETSPKKRKVGKVVFCTLLVMVILFFVWVFIFK